VHLLITWYEAIRDFLEMGGTVLVAIGILTLFMWILIIERVLYFHGSHRSNVAKTVKKWNKRSDKVSWNARQIRLAAISRIKLDMNQFLPLIKTMVALCPLLGLMGTVTGMIEVFDVMAVSGTGNARSMASGVSKATIPTMAGMVGALSGVFMTTWLTRLYNRESELLQDKLTLEH